ncbi:MAG: divalent metal cation transporter [Phycisphaerae bacterium]|nr:divalent metal cation transporter [Phycisphaerae bacterium]
MSETAQSAGVEPRQPWWRAIGPALITACVVFGPGSLLINSKVGATYQYDLLWLLIMTGVLMGTYVTMSARIGVVGQGSVCQLIASRMGRPLAVILGINLFLICSAFQFSNNIAVVAAVDALGVARVFGDPAAMSKNQLNWINSGVLIVFNALIVGLVFSLGQVYRVLERGMKVMVALILVCFLVNLLVVRPNLLSLLWGLIPGIPEGVSLSWPRRDVSGVSDPMILIASLMGTTFSVGGALFQSNLVREKGWKVEDYDRGFRDAATGVCILTGISAMIMATAGTVLFNRVPASEISDIGVLARQLEPLLGSVTHALFTIGLLAVAMNPFVINAMIGGTILADGLGQPPKLSDPWPRRFTVVVLLIGMAVALLVTHTSIKPVDAIVFGQALTVVGNPLMAAAILYVANRRDIMGERRNRLATNLLGSLGLILVILMAARVLWRLVLQFS